MFLASQVQRLDMCQTLIQPESAKILISAQNGQFYITVYKNDVIQEAENGFINSQT